MLLLAEIFSVKRFELFPQVTRSCFCAFSPFTSKEMALYVAFMRSNGYEGMIYEHSEVCFAHLARKTSTDRETNSTANEKYLLVTHSIYVNRKRNEIQTLERI